MMAWVCGLVMAVGAALAALVPDVRRSALSLWIAGLGAGGIYLSIGAETLAIIQWILSTLVTIAIVFFSVMFGEYRGNEKAHVLKRKEWLYMGLSALSGAGFVAIIYFAGTELDSSLLTLPETGGDLGSVGRVLSEKHMVSLEMVGLALFLVLIGASLVARPEGGDSTGGES